MRIAVLVSGSGTNLQALLDASKAGSLTKATLALVVSNRPGVAALARGEAANVPTIVIDHTSFASRQLFEEALLSACREHEIEGVVLAGFMRILSPLFVNAYANRILNTHPALCPAFPGIRAPQQAIDAGVKVSGCTVHLVDTGVDTGPILFQECVKVEPDDTATTLHARIQSVEHRLLPLAAELLASGGFEVLDGRVRLRP
tara:strand:+ start:7140 stop:7745 length:606 start_codon:yes stop_codon:yes gene_type:complete